MVNFINCPFLFRLPLQSQSDQTNQDHHHRMHFTVLEKKDNLFLPRPQNTLCETCHMVFPQNAIAAHKVRVLQIVSLISKVFCR